MNPLKTLSKIKSLEQESTELLKKLQAQPLLKSKNNLYLDSHKADFQKIWREYITHFKQYQKLIKKTKHRSMFFKISADNLVLKKYLLRSYFNALGDILEVFGEHEEFIRIYLDENFSNDYGKIAKFIYKYQYIKVLNIPNAFITPFKQKISPEIYDLLHAENMTLNQSQRLFTDYENIFFYIKYRLDKILYFLSKSIGKIISATKFSSRTHGLISQENLDIYLEKAKPGDIFLTRGNWNASNISIPGFWKHMSLYLGTGDFLQENFGKEYKNYSRKTHYIIEATGEGILVKPIQELISHNDYLGVTRTIFSKKRIERALLKALSHVGKDYDHRFNYYSDKNLVCSELVLKSYAPESTHDEGVKIHLEQIGVSLTYPPNKFIQKAFSDKSLKPYFFIDAVEKTGESFISNNKEFEKSGKRSRFSFLLK